MSTWVALLSKALGSMPNLQSFKVDGDVEDIVPHLSNLRMSLLSLPNITSLTLEDIGTKASESLAQAMDKFRGFSHL